MVGTCLFLINCLSNLGIILGRPPDVLANLGPNWPRSSRICPPIDCIRQTCQAFKVLTRPVLPECLCNRYRALAKITKTLTLELVRRLIITNCLINRLIKPVLAFTPITPLTQLVTLVDIETILNCFLSFIIKFILVEDQVVEYFDIHGLSLIFEEESNRFPQSPPSVRQKSSNTSLNGHELEIHYTPDLPF
jgi:hypothetical protein